eukprot:9802080-Alexandrium_andersonii.AAC.1
MAALRLLLWGLSLQEGTQRGCAGMRACGRVVVQLHGTAALRLRRRAAARLCDCAAARMYGS